MAFPTLFAVCAIGYSTMEPDWLRTTLTVTAAIIMAALLVVRPLRIVLMIWVFVMVVFTVWYVSDAPRNDRDWAPEYAVLATVSREGQTVRINNVRNFGYRSESHVIPNYYDATYNLDDLATLDLVTSYWAGDAIAHVFVTFGFTDGRHLAFSIETRRQKKFGYSTIAGLFHHYELFYVVADERDVIGVRTDIRHERVYLYRLNLGSVARQRLFLSYVSQVGRLATEPAWYNTITDNCTTGILARAGAKASVRYDWRVLLSGYAAQVAYNQGLLQPGTSFEASKAASLIRRPADATIDSHYSQEIRSGYP